jgi:hypothetical protein
MCGHARAIGPEVSMSCAVVPPVPTHGIWTLQRSSRPDSHQCCTTTASGRLRDGRNHRADMTTACGSGTGGHARDRRSDRWRWRDCRRRPRRQRPGHGQGRIWPGRVNPVASRWTIGRDRRATHALRARRVNDDTRGRDVLTVESVVQGLAIGLVMIAGTHVERADPRPDSHHGETKLQSTSALGLHTRARPGLPDGMADSDRTLHVLTNLLPAMPAVEHLDRVAWRRPGSHV